MHHLVFDGWSFDVFMRELCALYTAFIADKPSPLPQLAVQYANWSVSHAIVKEGAKSIAAGMPVLVTAHAATSSSVSRLLAS
jgi:hypothetical protein